MSLFRALFLLCLSLLCMGSPAWAVDSFRPALIFESTGNQTDNAFIEMMQRGAKRAHDEMGVTYQEFNQPVNADRVAFMQTIAQAGVTHIIAVGFQNVVPVLTLAEKYPAVKFTVIDGMVPPLFPNVQSINFKDQEGAFLVGLIAAKVAATNKIGFIGGMDVTLIQNFASGFYQGARYGRKDIELLRDIIGSDASAWNNPDKANALAKKQFNAGASVIFAAAGGSSVGVLHAAQEMGKFAIGVDTNQNGIYPRSVLTSMVKRVDNVVYDTLTNAYSGKWESGVKYLGIRENALDYAVDVNNKDVLPKAVIDLVEDAKDRIIRGLIQVEVYAPY